MLWVEITLSFMRKQSPPTLNTHSPISVCLGGVLEVGLAPWKPCRTDVQVALLRSEPVWPQCVHGRSCGDPEKCWQYGWQLSTFCRPGKIFLQAYLFPYLFIYLHIYWFPYFLIYLFIWNDLQGWVNWITQGWLLSRSVSKPHGSTCSLLSFVSTGNDSPGKLLPSWIQSTKIVAFPQIIPNNSNKRTLNLHHDLFTFEF